MGVSIRELIEAANHPIRSSAIQRNPEFIRLVKDRILDIVREGGDEVRIHGFTGYYHDTINGDSYGFPYVTSRDYFPGLDKNGDRPDSYRKIVDTLLVLTSRGIVGLDDELDVRRINWDDGSGAFIDGTDETTNNMLGKLGLPTGGQYVASDRPKLPNFYHQTFTAVDATVLCVMGNVVSEVGFLDTITISIHRAKASAMMLGETNPRGISRGTRTIAGTMIFTEGPEHPLLRIYPSSLMPNDEDHIEAQYQDWNSTLLSDQLPPFSIIIIWQNEYGVAKQLTLYNIEVTDEGFEYSKRNMEDQVVIQYKALDYDPPMLVAVGADGTIDPLNITKGGTSAFWERLWLLREGATLHDDPFEVAEEYFNRIDDVSTINNIVENTREGGVLR